MCGRVTLTIPNYERLAEELGVPMRAEDAALYRPRWNVAPTDPHWIVHPEPIGDPLADAKTTILEPAKWGLINFWAKDDKRASSQINARSESVATSRAFREAYEKRRCVVPVDGWYEWFGPQKARKPVWFHHANDEVVLLAGLWEDWRPRGFGDAEHPRRERAGSPKGDQTRKTSDAHKRRTFCVLTTDAKGLPATYHDRMPVRVPKKARDAWLSGSLNVETLIAGEMDDEAVVSREVSPRVNSVRFDDPSCLDPAPKTPTQGSLF